MTLDKFTFLIGIYERLLIDDKEEKWNEFVKITSIIINNNFNFNKNDIINIKYIINIIEENIFKNALLELLQEQSLMVFVILRNFLKEKYDEEITFKMIDEFYTIVEYYSSGGYRHNNTVSTYVEEYISVEKVNSPCKAVATLESLRVIKKRRLILKMDKQKIIDDDLPF